MKVDEGLRTPCPSSLLYALRRYVRRRGDWLVWLIRKDAELPRRWWMWNEDEDFGAWHPEHPEYDSEAVAPEVQNYRDRIDAFAEGRHPRG